MKASVYVPDDLWEQVQLEADFRLSAFVQQALRDRVDRRTERPYAKLGPYELHNTAAVHRHVLAQVMEAYRAGYDVGLEVAQLLPWKAFVDLAQRDWVVDQWRREFDDQEYEIVDRTSGYWPAEETYITWQEVMDVVMENREYMHMEDGLPTGVLREGFVDAIRAAWEGTPASDLGTRPEDEAVSVPEGDVEAGDIEEAPDGRV